MTVDQIISTLNSAASADRHAMQALVGLRVQCNGAMGRHAAIEPQVNASADGAGYVGLIGILSAIAAADGYAIDAIHDANTGELTGFEKRKR